MSVGPLDKEALIPLLEELSVLLALKGESPFKSRAYANAARVLEDLEGDLSEAIASRSLLKEKGIGPGIFETIAEWAGSGQSQYYEETKASVPIGLLEMLALRGLGVQKIRQIHESLGVSNLVDLEYACVENRLVSLPGFGKKTQEKIQNAIVFHKKHQGYLHAHTAQRLCESLLSELQKIKGVMRASSVGELRCRNEIVSGIDLIVSCESPPDLKAEVYAIDGIVATQCQSQIQSGFEILNCTMNDGIALRIYLVPDDRFSFLLHHLTGNDAYQQSFAARAKQFGIKVSEYGLFLEDHLLPCKDEYDLFSTLDVDYIPPELREGRGEMNAAVHHRLPKLVTENDIRGIFHVHTTYSDGSASLSEMVAAAAKAGYEYIGISDHSQSAVYAHGLKADRIRKQHKEIDGLRKKFQGIEILKGIESDILPDGSLDYDEETLSEFDFVIASVHSNFSMNEAEMTERVIRAVSHPSVTMLGHPTGRLLLSREAYPLNMPAVIEAARKNEVVIELNASPFRLDLDWRYCILAKEAGVRMSLNPDAHQIASMTDLSAGIGIARKGWLSSDDLINTLPKEGILAYLNQK